MAEELPDDKKFKAPPEDLVAVEKHFRPVDEEEIKAAETYSQRMARLVNAGARLTMEEKELASAMQQEEGYRMHGDCYGLAHVLILQGRYEEAAKVCPDRTSECDELIAARDRDDEDRCQCIAEKMESVSVPPIVPVKRLWIPEREAFNWLLRCNNCGQLNIVAQMPTDVLEYHGYRLDKAKRR